MKTTLITSLIILSSFSIANAQCTHSIGDLVWSDEFDTDGLPDPAKWNYDVGGGGWGNQESQYYTENREENARVEDGRLIIEARKETWEGNQYTSARLTSRNKGDWTYGRIEVKAKVPAVQGAWPAIWTLPTDWVYGGWPASGEMDIMESFTAWGVHPSEVSSNIHTEAYNHSIATNKGGTIYDLSNVQENYHVYAIDWYPNRMDFSVDGKFHFSFDNEGTWETWPFDQKFHLILNVAVGGMGGGTIDEDMLPYKMEVDYVRVYGIEATDGIAAPYQSNVAVIPGKIEAEHFDEGCAEDTYHDNDVGNAGAALRAADVDIEASSGADEGNFNVGWSDADEWLKYTVEVMATDTYKLSARVASELSVGQFHVEVDGIDITGSQVVTATGGWQEWATKDIGNYVLTAGTHEVRLYFEVGGINVNYLNFEKTSDTQTSIPTYGFDASLSLFPVPATSTLTIVGLATNLNYIITTTTGSTVYSGQVTPSDNTIITDHLSNGIYTLSFVDPANLQSQNLRFIK